MLAGEGYVSLTDNKYHYYLQDHQGNNRVVINQSGSVEETNYYYPFGGVFVETKGLGHTFITTGEGKDMVVYTYGRYGGLTGGKSSARNLSRNGEGVLIIMRGNEAWEYIKHETINKEASVYEVTNGSDEKIDIHFNEMFSSSKIKPSEGKYKNADNAKVVDTYDLWNKNCTTKSVEAIKVGTNNELNLNSRGPANIETQLYYENKKINSHIKRIDSNQIYEEYEKNIQKDRK